MAIRMYTFPSFKYVAGCMVPRSTPFGLQLQWKHLQILNHTTVRFYGVTVSTWDSESQDPSSNLGRTFIFIFIHQLNTQIVSLCKIFGFVTVYNTVISPASFMNESIYPIWERNSQSNIPAYLNLYLRGLSAHSGAGKPPQSKSNEST